MKVITLSVALAVLSRSNMVTAAPAPQVLTVWETATEVMNTDGSVYDQEATTATAAAVPTSAAPAAATTDTSLGSGSESFSLDSLLSGGGGMMKQWLSKMFGNGSGSSNGNSGASSTAYSSRPTGASSGSSGSPFGGFFDELLGDLGSGSGSGSDNTVTHTPSTLSTVSTSTGSGPGSTSTPTSSSSSGIYDEIYDSSDLDKNFARDILDAHNKDRVQHLANPLSWDTDAYNYAKKVAENYDCSGVLTHTHGAFGENLACGYKDGPSAVKAWYDEKDTYNYAAANEYNHFTQLVWKDTTKVGCAYKDCSSNNWGLYIICSYDPAGNVIGQEKANVLPN